MTSDGASVPGWIDALAAALERHGRAAIVVVAHVAGSVPRESGAAMVITADGQSGTIGGGHLEFEATRLAREALQGNVPATWVVRFPLAARVGQCCGGVATLVFATVVAGARTWLDAARACARGGAAFAVVSRVAGGSEAAARLIVTADDARGSLDDAGHDSAAIAFVRARLATDASGTFVMALPGTPAHSLMVQIERPARFCILLFGNGHVARALVRVLGVLPAHVRWIDARADDFPSDPPANVEVVVTDVPEAELRSAPAGSFVLVMTHSHALDFTLVETALARDDWGYVGMIGSRPKRAQLERRLLARGTPPARLAAIVCPIGAGLPGVTGKDPGSIAVGVAAELIATRAARAKPRHALVASPGRKGGFTS
jgi:xanthine dehydrogenase accessory factor